ncbi:MAG: ArsR family transcriptional regulator [Anaerolineales bacterium]|nr:ArsR family transcriptional regulator [Anaerolineales bacterium]
MQSTRQAILEYLKKNGHATVDDLAGHLALTPVTVRHHLDILRSENLVGEPIIRHRTSRGRPQYVFTLTDQASAHFPKNYDDLATKLLDEVRAQGGEQLVNVIFAGVAARLSGEAPAPPPDEPLAARLDRAVGFLNSRGYVSHWELTEEGVLLHTCNCPYEALAQRHPELCHMDLVLVGNLLGCVPQRVSRLAQGEASCAYLFKELITH